MKNINLFTFLLLLLWSRPVTAQKSFSDSLQATRIRAEKYFHQQGKQLEPEVLLVMSYICNYYHTKPPVNTRSLLKTKWRDEKNNGMQQFRKLAEPSFSISKEHIDSVSNTIDRLTLQALYCNQIQIVQDDLFGIIKNNAASRNVYRVTHSLLAFHLAEVNGCLTATESKRQELKTQMEESLPWLTEAIHDSDDKKFELYAFEYLSGLRTDSNQDMLMELMTKQQPNGGWKTSNAASRTSAHTSLLAYIILLHHLAIIRIK